MKKPWFWGLLLALLVLPGRSALAGGAAGLGEPAASFLAPAASAQTPGQGACGERHRILEETPSQIFLASLSSTSKNGCCVVYGCCTLIDSGCEGCPSGGLRWYTVYSCPSSVGGGTCEGRPKTCPTAC